MIAILRIGVPVCAPLMKTKSWVDKESDKQASIARPWVYRNLMDRNLMHGTGRGPLEHNRLKTFPVMTRYRIITSS